MKLSEIADRIGAKHIGVRDSQQDVQDVYAGDRISDLLEHASTNTLIISNLSSEQFIQSGELMEVAGICLVNGREPAEKNLDLIAKLGISVLVSPVGLFETCGRVYKCLFNKHS